MKTETILFSIVVPTWNRGEFIPILIKSVLEQEYTHFELIIVDDGSTDDTETVVQKLTDPRITYFKIKNSERAAARNYGAEKSKGHYVNFVDSDDFLLPNHLSEALTVVVSDNEPAVFHLNYAFKSPGSDKLKGSGLDRAEEMNSSLFLKGNRLSCNGVFIRRDVWEANRFIEDRELSASEDIELWMRLAARFPIRHHPVVTSMIVQHEERSVMAINADKLINRKEKFLQYVFSDPQVKREFGKYQSTVRASAYSYIALHLAMGRHFRKALRYFLKSLAWQPLSLFSRRSIAILLRLLRLRS